MAAASSIALFHKPTCSFYLVPSSAPARYRNWSSIFSLNRRRLCSFSAPPKTMADLVKTHAWRDGGNIDGEERFQAFEQEAFMKNSPSNDLVSDAGGGINAVANRLLLCLDRFCFYDMMVQPCGLSLAPFQFRAFVALKRILNQERPVATLRSDPGMPSSHAQSISFISLFTLFSVMEWLGTNELSLSLAASSLHWLLTLVSQKLHTASQVVVGAIVGSVYSTLWYITWNSLVLEAFASSFSVQVAVFTAAAASALGFAVYVLLNWFKDDR
ncbi:hypothetical protein Bca101_101738 [Brassica carinata]